MRILFILPLFLLVSVAQQPPTTSQSGVVRGSGTGTLRLTRRPPPVTLQQAVQIAEKYIAESKIPIERYWLRSVRWGMPEGVKPEGFWGGSRWSLFWDNFNASTGDYVEIEVDMDGHPLRRPSM